MGRRYRQLVIVIATVLSVVALSPLAAADSGAVSQGFKTTDDLAVGSLVVFKAGDQGYVQAATSDKASQLVGVTADNPLVSLGSGTKQAQIVVSGQTQTLVSDINGDIKVGDKITASPIAGVGMKVGTSTQIVGTAQSNLHDAQNTTTTTVKDKTGASKQVHIGAITVQVNVTYYATNQSKLSALVPTFLLNTGSAIAGKDVSPLRILIGFSALLIGFIVAGVILQSAVRSGIISIGRNPLAHTALRQSLIDVLLTTMGLLIITIIFFYLILTL